MEKIIGIFIENNIDLLNDFIFSSLEILSTNGNGVNLVRKFIVKNKKYKTAMLTTIIEKVKEIAKKLIKDQNGSLVIQELFEVNFIMK